MHKADVARAVAVRLFEAEDSIDAALKQAARLMAAMVDARRDLGLSAVAGEDVAQRTAAALTALTAARAEMVQVHAALATTRDKLGLRTVALGALDKPADPHSLGIRSAPEAGAAQETWPSRGTSALASPD